MPVQQLPSLPLGRNTQVSGAALQVAVTYIPAPSFILFCQLASCALYVKISAIAGVVDAEPLEWSKSKKFALIVFGFIGTLFSNVTSLRVSDPASWHLCDWRLIFYFFPVHAHLPCLMHDVNTTTHAAITCPRGMVGASYFTDATAGSAPILLRPCCVMQYVPVDTIICFRASCPIVIAVIEFFYLNRELPSLRSWASLFGEPQPMSWPCSLPPGMKLQTPS